MRILAGFDIVDFLLLLPSHFHEGTFLLTKVADCFLGWARFVSRMLSSIFALRERCFLACHQVLYEVDVNVLA